MYEIKVLDSEEFDRVAKSDPRYSYVDESNMGFADREKSVAYVRDSKIHDLNKYLINHELEEMIEAESHHEDANGIRHKKFFKDIFAPLTYNPGGMFGGSGKGPLNFLNPNNRKAEEPAAPAQDPFAFLQASPMNQFGLPGMESAGTKLPDYASPGANISSNLNQGIDGVGGGQQLSPELLQRLKGNYSGRLVF